MTAKNNNLTFPIPDGATAACPARQGENDEWRRQLRRTPRYSILGDRAACPRCDSPLSLRMTRSGAAWFCRCLPPRLVQKYPLVS
jgi:hypothetical protein